MKRKPIILLATFVVAMGLLLGASTAQATEVIFDGNGNATGIEDLPVTDENTGETTIYNVDFRYETGINVYESGFDFPDDETILVARQEVNNALNADNAELVGEVGSDQFFIGNKWQDGLLVAVGSEYISEDWETCERDCIAVFGVGGVGLLNPQDFFIYADFTEADGPPPPPPADPVTIGGIVTGLEGIGLVLQNNDGDDEPIAVDGDFTFDTPLTPGGLYNVTVSTQPTDPAQTCSVENGSGTVPDQAVTNVAVSCGEAVLSDLIKLVAEGDTLPDSTVLKDILLDGGVSINIDGQVAFGGRDGDGTDAAFTQAGKVVAEGDTLEDDTVLAAFRGQGEVAISSGGSGESGAIVAFHGHAETGLTDTAAVFTQAGKIAAVGDTLSADITVDDIDPEGKVAINNFDQVAFHGSVEIEGGLFDEQFRVVFISDGQETREAAREASDLPDGTPLDDINESGGVAISDFDEVAFHGQSVFPESGGDSLKAVFTSNGLAAKEDTELDDGTILDDINENGGVAINLFGEVAFHGRTDGDKAVFTQYGLVAKVGDNLDESTTLNEIWDTAGVAITPYGPEVAFHGKVGTTDAVFVGQAPTIEPAAGGEETSGE